MAHMNMKYLRSFLALVEDRSSAKAALRLDISRHNIVPHVAAVERLVGRQLLEARLHPVPAGETSRTQLTDAGREFLPKARRAMEAHDEMLDARAVAADPIGLRIAIVSGLLELTLDAARNNLSDADQELVNTILLNAELETPGVPARRLRRSAP